MTEKDLIKKVITQMEKEIDFYKDITNEQRAILEFYKDQVEHLKTRLHEQRYNDVPKSFYGSQKS